MAVEPWRDAFKASTLRTSFVLSLTRPMLEFISAVADGVSWDRASHGSCAAYPDNFIAVGRALEKRGLLTHRGSSCRSDSEAASRIAAKTGDKMDWYTYSAWSLTPAGEKVVELLKITGLFIEADAAIRKKTRKVKA